MAKHLNTRLLHPPTTTTIKPKPPGTPLSLRRDPHPLPPSTTLLRKPIHPGPRLPATTTASFPTLHHGQQIYLYLNLHTSQVLYSLTRHMNNAAARAQLPFIAKKTQLPHNHLRKDLWVPFALASFPSRFAGLDAYRKLREFRRLHETSYPLELVRDRKNPKALLPKKQRARVLMNQKANSVADLAAVLCQLEEGPSRARKERFERVQRRVRWVTRVRKLGAVEGGEEREEARKARERRRGRLEKVDVGVEMQGCRGVEVRWMDVRDAEMAERWPQEVVHSLLGRSRYTAAWPGRDAGWEDWDRRKREREERGEVVEEVVVGGGKGKEAEPSEEAVRAGLALPKKTWREWIFGRKGAVRRGVETEART